ncbi:hypothetical protein [Moraxella phage Mcat17]|uniref:hypothetical protein n=1 Tax=Moraxella catarrhalis TaxID=480 RepID=UPI00072142C5|nr:hypothetical protein [Moraxella catarrhalis]AKI27688.1 hypothetical protein [Moraxella phage Mcat17]MPW64208.1 hypothetical protein [Moraxella catarrhalis]
MLNKSIVANLVSTIGFELDLTDAQTKINISNPAELKRFIAEYDHSDNKDAQEAIDELKAVIAEHETKAIGVSKDELKQVYVMLKERQLHPRGEFDKAGRFYLDDADLVDVRPPSTKYPYSQMSAGRTAKFVKAMAEKYKVQTIEELISLFKKA